MKKILVVEDDKFCLEVINDFLKKFHDITVAYDGADAFNKYGMDDFDMVITDIDMPNMNGVELVSKIRQENPNIKIIIMSALSDYSHMETLVGHNIFCYIFKPVDMVKVFNSINKCFGYEELELS